jgi:hypothetical protein
MFSIRRENTMPGFAATYFKIRMPRGARAFSSEVDSGSRKENASK